MTTAAPRRGSVEKFATCRHCEQTIYIPANGDTWEHRQTARSDCNANPAPPSAAADEDLLGISETHGQIDRREQLNEIDYDLL